MLLVKLHSPASKIVSMNKFNDLLNDQDMNAHTQSVGVNRSVLMASAL